MSQQITSSRPSVRVPKLVALLITFIIFTIIVGFNNISYGQKQTTDNGTSQNQQPQLSRNGAPIVLIPGITGNILTVVSFLIGTASFVLGLRLQTLTKDKLRLTDVDDKRIKIDAHSDMLKNFEILIVALIIPAIVINIYGIILLQAHLYYEDSPYLLLLFTLFIPAIAILFLVRKLH